MNDGDEWDILTFKRLLTFLHFPTFILKIMWSILLWCVFIQNLTIWILGIANFEHLIYLRLTSQAMDFSHLILLLPQSYQIVLIHFSQIWKWIQWIWVIWSEIHSILSAFKAHMLFLLYCCFFCNYQNFKKIFQIRTSA